MVLPGNTWYHMVTHTVTSHVIHLQALSSKPIGFLRLVGLLAYYIKSGFASTARARARLWQNQQMSFGSDIPDHTMSILLGLGFSVVAPLIAPIGLLYFLVMLLIGKYQMVYVYTESYQSGGKVRCKAFEAEILVSPPSPFPQILSLFLVCFGGFLFSQVQLSAVTFF